jgi:hypothetical protein
MTNLSCCYKKRQSELTKLIIYNILKNEPPNEDFKKGRQYILRDNECTSRQFAYWWF